METGGSDGSDSSDGVYTSGAGRVFVPALCLVGVGLVARSALRGEYAQALVAAVWLVASGTAAYLLFWRPTVRVGPDGVELLNPLRDVAVPWEALLEVRTRFALTLVTAQGEYVSWAAPAPGRPVGDGSFRKSLRGVEVEVELPPTRGGEAMSIPASRRMNGDAGAAAFLVEAAWQRWRQDVGRRGGRREGEEAGGGDGLQDGPDRVVAVRWHPLPAATALISLVLGIVLVLV